MMTLTRGSNMLEHGSDGAPPICILATMPAEIVWLIRNLLSPASRTCLALTAKSFFSYFGLEPLGSEGKRDLILLLEREDPMNVVCFGCYRLTRLDRGPAPAWCEQCASKFDTQHQSVSAEMAAEDGLADPSQQTRQSMKDAKHSWQSELGGPEILFSDAHLIMNRHLYGEPHGLPIDVLQRSYTFERFLPSFKSYVEAQPHFPLERHETYVGRSLYHIRDKEARQATNVAARPSPYKSATLVPLPPVSEKGREQRPRTTELRPAEPLPDEAIPWSFSHTYAAKIIDGELYVSRTHHVVGPPGYSGNIQTAVANFRIPFCMHVDGDPVIKPRTRTTLSQGSKRQPLGRENKERHYHGLPGDESPSQAEEDGGQHAYFYNDWCRSGTRKQESSCRYCYTDYDVSLCIRENDRFYLDVVTYHRLGTCRDPDAHVWILLTKDDDMGVRSRRRRKKARLFNKDPGHARAQWHKDGTGDGSSRSGS